MMKEYIKKMLKKGYIRPNLSPYAAPVLIMKKPDNNLKVYINYRALNAFIIKNRNAPSLIHKTLFKLC